MKISKKIAGLTVAGVVAASGVAYAAVETTSSAPAAKNVSSSHHYGSSHTSSTSRSSSTGRDAGDRSRSAGSRQTPRMWMSGRYNVVHVHNKIAVVRLIGHKWRRVGWLRANSRHVLGVWWPYRYTTTVIVVVNPRKVVTIVVKPNTVIVVATNGQIGIVPAFYLHRWTPQPTRSPSMTPTPTMTPPASPTPTPTGSQSAVVGGLQGRTSSKW